MRAVLLKLLPFLPAAKEREAHSARLYGIWDGWIQQMLARGPPSESDDSMWACISRVRDPSTGLFAHTPETKTQRERQCPSRCGVMRRFWLCGCIAMLG